MDAAAAVAIKTAGAAAAAAATATTARAKAVLALARQLAEEEEAAQRVVMIEAEAAFPSLSVVEQLRRDDAESRRLQHEREERQCEAAERKRVEAGGGGQA